jgi:hypothetical protein
VRSLLGLLCAVLLVAGCSDDPPYIHDMTYTPNAGFINTDMTVTGQFQATDDDMDISQMVWELISPSQTLVARSPANPVMSMGTGVVGPVTFTLPIDHTLLSTAGIYQFNLWLIDLKGRKSNSLSGLLRIATMNPGGP